jgi:hypothetical protein
MNVSRIALLSLGLFFTPIFADAPQTPATTVEPGALKKFATNAAHYLTYIPATIADKSYLNAGISYITETKYIKGTCFDKPATIGTAITSAAIIAGLYAVYSMYTAQNTDIDEDDIFEDDAN